MPKPVRVGDYYENDDNGLWSWYLEKIRSGDFEELIQNELKFTLLKRFLYNKLINEDTLNNNKNSKILFISIPDNIHSDISLLETFLKDYFHLEDLTNIKIVKLTQGKSYNHESHYVLIDREHNFNDSNFLDYVSPKNRKYNGSIVGNQTQNYTSNNSNTSQSKFNSIINYTTPNIEIPTSTKTNRITNSTTLTPSDKLMDTVRTITTTTNHKLRNTGASISLSTSSSISSVSSSGSYTDSNDVSPSITSSDQSIGSAPQLISTFSNNLQREEVLIAQPLDGSNNQISNINSNIKNKDKNNQNNNPLTTDTADNRNNSTNSVNLNKSVELDDNASSIIEINFPKTRLHDLLSKEQEKQKQFAYSKTYNPRAINGSFYTPPQSEIVSISSYGDNNSNVLEMNTEPLRPTTNRSDILISTTEDKESNNYDIESANAASIDNYSNCYTNSIRSSITFSTDTTSYSILPSISIKSPHGHFRLVLQSTLTLNEDRQIYTAIRQSNNSIDDADVDDDWILYDQNFSMNNLIMLTLKDLFEWGHNLKKILFYSMVFIDDIGTEGTSNSFKNAENNVKDCNGLENGDDTPHILYAEDGNQLNMLTPERIQTNNIIAHRSIRTINSIGEWAFKRKSFTTDRYSKYENDSTDSEYYPESFNGNDNITRQNTKQNMKAGDKISQGKKQKKHSFELVERWKSMPNKGATSNETKRWRNKMKRFSKGRNQSDNDTFCNIM